MCYFLYGAVNEGINLKDYEKAVSGDRFHFSIGTKEDIFNCVNIGDDSYRLTVGMCDCSSSIGGNKSDEPELYEMKGILESLEDVRGIKYVYLCKNWYGENLIDEEVAVHIKDINILEFLATIKENCLYRIYLYKRY